MKDKNKKQLHIGDIIQDSIYNLAGDKIGEIISVIKRTKKGLVKEVIADNGGVGYILKGTREKLEGSNFSKIKRIGYNYQAKEI